MPRQTLLRYVDDFLFISTERERAGRFLRTMDDGAASLVRTVEVPLIIALAGIPEYGCSVSAEKRLTNFDIALADGEVVPPLPVGGGKLSSRFVVTCAPCSLFDVTQSSPGAA